MRYKIKPRLGDCDICIYSGEGDVIIQQRDRNRQYRRPHDRSYNSIRWAGMFLLDEKRLLLECENCGVKFSPDIQPGGKLSRDWWMCPYRCNAGAT